MYLSGARWYIRQTTVPIAVGEHTTTRWKFLEMIEHGGIQVAQPYIEIIGEATKQLSFSLTNRYPHIPWSDIARMRDKLIHQYFGVDLATVWLTATADLPVLRQDIEIIITTLGLFPNKSPPVDILWEKLNWEQVSCKFYF